MSSPEFSSNQTYLIIPGYNEAKYLDSVLKKVTTKTKSIIYVDDGSSDDSTEIARQYTKHVLKHPINLGKGAAMKTGCEYAFNQLQAEAVIFMDGDDQHDPEDLEKFYQIFAEHGAEAGLIFGERSLDSRMPLIRIIGNRMASYLVTVTFGNYIPDIPSGFKAMTKDAYQKIKWQSSDYGVE